MKTTPETVVASDGTGETTVETVGQTCSDQTEKRPLEDANEDEGDGADRKKCRTDDGNDQPALSKRQLKKIVKQQKWLESKSKRR